MGSGRPAARERSVMARLEHFCDEEGLSTATLSHEVMAAFVDKGLLRRTPSTRGTYRISYGCQEAVLASMVMLRGTT